MDKQTFKCPLCESLLSREKFIQITGQWKEIEESKRKLQEAEKAKILLEKKYQLELKKASKTSEAIGIAKGIKKEKSERERMSKLLQNQAKQIIESNKRIQLLEKQLKEGKTPQTAGFDYEKEVAKLLSENFPDDEIKPTGKLGDNIQIVKYGGEIAGSILYECKQTSKYSSLFVLEVKRHQQTAACTYAVVVTHATKTGKSKFFVEDGIIVIDPFGLLDLALFLRTSIIEMHQLKLTKEKTDEKSKEILRYMQTGVFKTHMTNAITKSEEAYDTLIQEMKDHKKLWLKRYEIYSTIHANVQAVRSDIGRIITGGELPLPKSFPNPLIAVESTSKSN